jgi:hypothetical protein
MRRPWLLTALRKDGNYGPAHEALTKLYEKRGDTSKADKHRLLAQKAKSKAESQKRKDKKLDLQLLRGALMFY